MSNWIRSNVLGLVAIFIALGGTTYAAQKVDSGDIDKNAVKSKHIGSGQVKSGDIGDGQVGTADLADSAVNSAKVADNSLTGADVNESTLSGVAASPTGAAGGALTGSYPDPSLAPGTVGSSALADEAVTGGKIAAGTIDQSRIETLGLGTGVIADGAVTGGKLATDAVTGDKVQNASIDGVDIGIVDVREVDLPSIPAHTCSGFGFVPSGTVTARDLVVTNVTTAGSNIGDSFVVTGDRPGSASSVAVKVCNITNAAADPANHEFTTLVLDL
jgi:hypothetical protein